MIRFLHSSDWQLGMTRHFLAGEAQARFTQARFDVIRTLVQLAETERCGFIVVAGDVFESNQIDRRTLLRALDAMRESPVPVLLLPGNHDPLDAASLFRSSAFLENKPEQVQVLEDSRPVAVAPGVEVVAAPWTSKRPLQDLVAAAVADLEAVPGLTRVCLAHGAVDILSPDPDDPSLIRLAAAEKALAEGRIHYLALGDRHSCTSVGDSGRIRYSGAPEPTNYREIDPGKALVVEIDAGSGVDVVEHSVAAWRFEEKSFQLDTDEDLDALDAWLEALPQKERVIVKLRFSGSLTLRQRAQLEERLAHHAELLAALERREKEFVVLPEDSDFSELELAGFAQAALDDLRVQAVGEDEDVAATARDALALLVRLARTES